MTGFLTPIVLFAFLYAAQYESARALVPQPLYRSLFPKPTGTNGYEEFVMAEDLFTSSPIFLESERIYGESSSTSVDTKRKLLNDAASQRVLSLVQAGLRKRIHSPRPAPELYTLIPELRDLRAIARLMCTNLDVLFADGKTTDAIDCLNDALTFGRDVQAGTLSSGTVGLYIENTVLQDFAAHIGALSIEDCDWLARVTGRHLKLPDPQTALVTAERDMFLRTLRRDRKDASRLLDKLDPGPNSSKSVRRDFIEVCRLAKDDPHAGEEMIDRAADLVDAHFAGSPKHAATGMRVPISVAFPPKQY
jgi:hypothetical protein